MAKVFISYRHEDGPLEPEHNKRVRELAEFIHDAGIDVTFDGFYIDKNPGGPPQQWPAWCEEQVPKADKVIMIASTGYFRCYSKKETPGVGLGAACETTVIRNTLYDSSYVDDKIRIVFFSSNYVSEIPPALNGIHRFDGLNAKDKTKLLDWLSAARPASPQIAITEIKRVDWPEPLSSFKPDIANRTVEFGYFVQMIANQTSGRVLLLEAASNHGKTGLIRVCSEYLKITLKPDSYAVVDFKGNPSKEFALDTLRLELINRFPTFGKAGSNAGDLRRDLRNLSDPTVILFDTYEKASPDAREFVEGLILADLDKTPGIKIIVAGQSVPNHTKALWSSIAQFYHLGPISDPTDWWHYISPRHGELKIEHVQALTIAAHGNPGVVSAMLDNVAGGLKKTLAR